MDGKQSHVLVHLFVHLAVELREWRQVSANLVLLISRLFEETLRYNKTYVLPGQKHLRKAIPHAAKTVGYVLKATAVEDAFLHTSHETESKVLCYLANLTQ